ncbi:MAG: aminotransferase class I/II-fold pyridoxal phosphate-dependent enzyme [Promethearchaeota archaeon]
MKVARRLQNMEYPIRDVAVLGKRLKNKGKKIYYLNIGDPVNPEITDFRTPDYIIEALANASRDGYNMYADSLGVPELREKIAQEEKRRNGLNLDPDDIILTNGVSEAIFFVCAGLVERGDEVLLPGPVYPPYISYTKFFGGTPVEYKLDEEKNWQPDIEDLKKKITENTKFILMCSPNNPTGALFDEDFVEAVGDIAQDHNIPIISDEIYDQIIYEKMHSFKCLVSILKGRNSLIGMNGFSKAHLSTGWRLGYMYFYDPDKKLEKLKSSIESLARTRLCVNVPAQYAAITTMEDPRDHTKKMVQKLWKRRDFCIKRINEIDGISSIVPDGAFYLFPRLEFLRRDESPWKSDREFVVDLLNETGIMTVFGSGFGKYGKDHLRITFLSPIEILEEVFNLFEDFLKKRLANA